MTLSAQALTRMQPGRKRLPNVRRGSDGRSDGEHPAIIRAVGKAIRMKFYGADEKTWADERNGSTIGRLFLEGALSETQYNTALRYETCVSQVARLLGIPSPHARSAALLFAGHGQSCAPEPDPEWVTQVKGRFRDCRRALLDCGKDLLVGSDVNRIVYGVVIEDWPMGMVGAREMANLRCGLNALGRVLK